MKARRTDYRHHYHVWPAWCSIMLTERTENHYVGRWVARHAHSRQACFEFAGLCEGERLAARADVQQMTLLFNFFGTGFINRDALFVSLFADRFPPHGSRDGAELLLGHEPTSPGGTGGQRHRLVGAVVLVGVVTLVVVICAAASLYRALLPIGTGHSSLRLA